MARILGAVASSHTPTIGFALDTNKQKDPVWAPIFEDYRPVQEWLAAKKPDVLLMIFNDHVTSFFFDHYSQFALGIGEKYEVADEGGGPRDLPGVRGHAEERWRTILRRVWSQTNSICPISRTRGWIMAASRRYRSCGRMIRVPIRTIGRVLLCRCRLACWNFQSHRRSAAISWDRL